MGFYRLRKYPKSIHRLGQFKMLKQILCFRCPLYRFRFTGLKVPEIQNTKANTTNTKPNRHNILIEKFHSLFIFISP